MGLLYIFPLETAAASFSAILVVYALKENRFFYHLLPQEGKKVTIIVCPPGWRQQQPVEQLS